MPLQSGDDGVLRAMGRRYSTATYLRRLEPLAGEFNLTSDVIVGFPAEDETAFARTLETVEAAGLTRVHVFPYSPRPGTETAADDRVPPPEKKERGARLRALSRELEQRRWQAKLGSQDVVLVDRPGRGLRRRLLAVPRRRARRRARPRPRRAAVTEEGILAVAA